MVNPTDTDIELPANKVVASVNEVFNDHIHELSGSQSVPNSANVNSASTNQCSTSEEINFNISNENLSQKKRRDRKKILGKTKIYSLHLWQPWVKQTYTNIE